MACQLSEEFPTTSLCPSDWPLKGFPSLVRIYLCLEGVSTTDCGCPPPHFWPLIASFMLSLVISYFNSLLLPSSREAVPGMDAKPSPKPPMPAVRLMPDSRPRPLSHSGLKPAPSLLSAHKVPQKGGEGRSRGAHMHAKTQVYALFFFLKGDPQPTTHSPGTWVVSALWAGVAPFSSSLPALLADEGSVHAIICAKAAP